MLDPASHHHQCQFPVCSLRGSSEPCCFMMLPCLWTWIQATEFSLTGVCHWTSAPSVDSWFMSLLVLIGSWLHFAYTPFWVHSALTRQAKISQTHWQVINWTALTGWAVIRRTPVALGKMKKFVMMTHIDKSFQTNKRDCVFLSNATCTICQNYSSGQLSSTQSPALDQHRWTLCPKELDRTTKTIWMKAQFSLHSGIHAFMTQRRYCYCDRNSKLD